MTGHGLKADGGARSSPLFLAMRSRAQVSPFSSHSRREAHVHYLDAESCRHLTHPVKLR